MLVLVLVLVLDRNTTFLDHGDAFDHATTRAGFPCPRAAQIEHEHEYEHEYDEVGLSCAA